MCIQRITATSIAVAGTGDTAVTTITVPASVTFMPGCVYDLQISAQVPADTNGTIINITNGTATGSLFQCLTANYARARALGSKRVLRVRYFGDPDHFNLLGVR